MTAAGTSMIVNSVLNKIMKGYFYVTTSLRTPVKILLKIGYLP